MRVSTEINPSTIKAGWITNSGITLLTSLLFLTGLPGCIARHQPNWSKVQAISAGTPIEGRLYDDEAPRGKRKIQGRFLSATDDFALLQLSSRSTETLRRPTVRQVLIHRPFWKRKAGWIALGATLALVELYLRVGRPPAASQRLGGHGMITVPIATAVFYDSRMGNIYNVPPTHKNKTRSLDPPPAKTKNPSQQE